MIRILEGRAEAIEDWPTSMSEKELPDFLNRVVTDVLFVKYK